MKLLMTSQMGNASGSCVWYTSGCPLLREIDTLLLFCPALQREMVNSISRSGREDLSRLCSATWCFFAVGHICVKCLDLFKYQRRKVWIWIVLTLPGWWAVCRIGHVFKKSGHFLRLALPRPGQKLGRQISLGWKVFYIIRARLSYEVCPLPGGRWVF